MEGSSGESYWQWTGAQPPLALQVAGDLDQPSDVRLDYQSAQAAPSNVPVTLKRRLLRLVPGDKAFEFRAEEVGKDEISSADLYLDEVTLSSETEQPLRYGMLEIPLPPGADVERTTWGIQVSGLGGDEASALEKARNEPGELSYAVPVDSLEGELVLRHLVRFSQKGEFCLLYTSPSPRDRG